MLNISKLFGSSPLAPLQTHMERVAECVHKLNDLFAKLEAGDFDGVQETAEQISKLEHDADLLKNDIRNHLPRGLFMSINRAALLEMLSLQDGIADMAEDVAVLVSMKKLEVLDLFRDHFHGLLKSCLEVFEGTRAVMQELDELMESSFGGIEADLVRKMVHAVAEKEHQADLIQRELMKALFNADGKIDFISFSMWQRIFEGVANIANLSETLAHRVRMTLECG